MLQIILLFLFLQIGQPVYNQPKKSREVPTVIGLDNKTPIFENSWEGFSDQLNYDVNWWWTREQSFWSYVNWSNPRNYNNEFLKQLWIYEHPNQKPPWLIYTMPVGGSDILLLFLISYGLYKFFKGR